MTSPNSPYHHYIMLLSPGPDSEYNMRVYGKYLNKNMARLLNMNVIHPLSFVLTLDTKAQWQVLLL